MKKSNQNLLFFALCITLLLSYSCAKILPENTFSSSLLLRSLTRSVLSFSTPGGTTYRFSPYDLLENTILSIKSSEIMQKKYAAKYGGIIKRETKAKQEDVRMGNILESDVSAKGISFINTPAVPVDADSLLAQPLAFYPQDGAPRVLIVHTHTSEAYAESPNSRSEDNNKNVVAVGKEIKKALEKKGIGVIHDTTQNDNPSYNQSYTKALSVIEKNLAAYPTLEVVLDIHRDYIKRDDGTLLKPTITTKSGEKAAQIMFVMGTDSMGLYHPNWRHNLAFSAQIQKHLQDTVPGLCRSINIRTERFNQHATKGSMIIEVGTGVNTIEEAKLSGKYAGEAIGDVLKAIK
ncbi:MAG: stage II sporulation protein P [Clostridia bacterium]|nr:stage II sporulation protein P [Clostridia bacterium]